MFLMPYGYNPTTAQPVAFQAPPKIVESIQFISAVDNDASVKKDIQEPGKVNRKPFRPSGPIPGYAKSIEHRIGFINQDLSRRKKLYRFKLRKSKKVFIDMEILNEEGGIEKTYSREITEKNYKDILDNVSSGEGFIFED